jgi:alkane 1-monooxygenase
VDEGPSRPSKQEASEVTGWLALRTFLPHLLALVFPLNALAFVLTAPHSIWAALLFAVPIYGSVLLDRVSGTELRQPSPAMPAWPFDGLLLLLVLLQLANVALLGRAMAAQGVLSIDTFAAMIVVGSSSGYSGIVVAHELIHRPSKRWQWLGRLLLSTVLYEHFYTEHVRGHHVRVGTDEDPATARFGESFTSFYLRTVPAQFRSAWRLETARLGDADMKWYDLRLLRSRVVHGLVFELGLSATMLAFFGVAALVAHVLQAWWASRALEVVNYFEHWGLRRESKRVLPSHSWDTHSRFTYFALTGLSRHADHHAFASRPYQQLRVWEASPKLPGGYLEMFPLVLLRNRRYQRLMTEELRRKQLGPFAAQEQTTAISSEPPPLALSGSHEARA